MHAFTRLSALGLLLGPLLTLAAPSTSTDADGPRARSRSATLPVRRREDGKWESWDGNPDGNLEIYVSEEQLNIGSLPALDALASVYPECSPNSCGPGVADGERDTDIVSERWYKGTKRVRTHADGTFRADGPGTRGDMFALAVLALEAMEQTESWLWHDNMIVNLAEDGKRLAKVQDNEPNVEHWYPKIIHLQLLPPDTKGVGPALDLEFSVESRHNFDFCSTIQEVGGAVNGVTGGVGVGGIALSLVTLGCL